MITTKRKLFFVSLAIMAPTIFATAQSYVLQYQYDAAGNRVSRSVVEVQSPQNSPRLMDHGDEVSVSPTVTTDDVTISTTLDTEQTAMRYIVSNLQGSVMTICDITSQQTIVPFSNYESGIYLLTIQSEQGLKTFKIIKI